MAPSIIINEPFQLDPTALMSVEDCSEESIYALGSIQPHGMVLALSQDLTILQVSENVESFLGLAPADLLGQPLHHLFSRAQVQQIAERITHEPSGFHHPFANPFKLKVRRSLQTASNQPNPPTFRTTLHHTPDALILELEPLPKTPGNHVLQSYHHLQAVILKLRRAQSLLELSQVLAQEIKAMTGFDRVMVYRFEADHHGSVIAEAKEAHLESFLGLHYPATDIPPPARSLFYRNWVRQIPDIHYQPVMLHPVDHPLTGQSLDLSACVLRGVSPCHLTYLSNMGVAASLAISLIDGQNLWGLIACHHYSPRLVDYETRKTCEFIGQFASVELVHQQDHELEDYRLRAKAIQDQLQRALLQDLSLIQPVLVHHAPELLELVNASGAAIALDRQITLIGQTPPQSTVKDLLAWLTQLHQHEIYLTDCLVRPYPAARAYKQVASGILAISIVLNQKSYHLVWFRPEQIQTVNWAGKPQDTITRDELGKLHLSPRKSFELWKDIVQETSQPWTAAEIEAALLIRNTLMLAVLELSQTALEQAAERAAIANRAKSQFLAKMSHELRTPLNAILGFTQVMTHSPTMPEEFHEYLDIINRSGEHLLALINDVLEMSRIEAGQLVLNERNFNLHALLQDLRDLFVLKVTQKGLNLVFEELPGLPRHICSDEGKLRQVLINLISNAIKFTTQGSITVRVWAEPLDSAPAPPSKTPGSPPQRRLNLFFTVTDTGCGIEHQHWESIFEAFIQTEQGRQANGTGLGLSISRQFARLMGGDLTVQSTLQQGSTFSCQIVSYQPEAMDLLKSEALHPVTGLEPGKEVYRILVVEDVPENRQLLKTLLEPVGFQVLSVSNGEEAIAQWQRWQPHLILMDIGMQGMDGYAVTEKIRAQEEVMLGQAHESAPKTKIIALTAYAFETDRVASLDAGCDGYLAKPFTETALFEAIAQQLEVQYRYAHSPAAPGLIHEAKRLTPEDLSHLPPAWKQQIHNAALDLNDDKLRQLLSEVSPADQRLIDGLTHLIDNFQLEAIATLTQT